MELAHVSLKGKTTIPKVVRLEYCVFESVWKKPFGTRALSLFEISGNLNVSPPFSRPFWREKRTVSRTCSFTLQRKGIYAHDMQFIESV